MKQQHFCNAWQEIQLLYRRSFEVPWCGILFNKRGRSCCLLLLLLFKIVGAPPMPVWCFFLPLALGELLVSWRKAMRENAQNDEKGEYYLLFHKGENISKASASIQHFLAFSAFSAFLAFSQYHRAVLFNPLLAWWTINFRLKYYNTIDHSAATISYYITELIFATRGSLRCRKTFLNFQN